MIVDFDLPKKYHIYSSGLLSKVDITISCEQNVDKILFFLTGSIRVGPKVSDVQGQSSYFLKADQFLLNSHSFTAHGFNMSEEYQRTGGEGFCYLKNGQQQPTVVSATDSVDPLSFFVSLFNNQWQRDHKFLMIGGKNRTIKLENHGTISKIVIGDKINFQIDWSAKRPKIKVPILNLSLEVREA